MSIFRRMLNSSAMLHAAEDGSGTAAPDAGTANAGGDPADPAAGTVAADAGTAAAGSPAVDGAAPPEPAVADGGTPPAASAPDPAQRRLNQLVAERWAERRRAEASEAQNRLLQEQLNQTRAAAAQPTLDADGNPVQPSASPVRSGPQPDLQAMAAQIAAQNDFNRQVGEEVAKGRTAHTDFDQVAANLQRFGELPRTFVEAAMATGKGADVMYHLGGDIAEADRILSLQPIQQAVALATLAGTLKAPASPKTITSAPAPVSPKVGGGATKNTPSLEDPNMPVADWIKQREKELSASKGQRAARR